MTSVAGYLLLASLILIFSIVIYVLCNYREACERCANKFMRKMGFFIILICIIPCLAQEDPFGEPFGGFDEPMTDGPIVFPETLPKAANLIVDAIGNESDHMWFMSPEYWPVPLNNSTIMNLTA